MIIILFKLRMILNLIILSCAALQCHGFLHSPLPSAIFKDHRLAKSPALFSKNIIFGFPNKNSSFALFAQREDIGQMQPKQLVSLGMKTFAESRVQDSIELFDRADEGVPNGSLTPFLWQRGISLYYADRFQEGSNQVGH